MKTACLCLKSTLIIGFLLMGLVVFNVHAMTYSYDNIGRLNNVTYASGDKIGSLTFELKPVEVTQAPEGTKAGIYVTVDGTVKMVTDSGQQVILLAEPQQLDELTTLLNSAGFDIERGAYGELRFVAISS
ncbi:MAG: hypothetical protein KZQ83_10735 [gamma proteobacterium symbiont of Taylorina sp.]|nr:hypothetical protein [gamma proteobacterium symbiont of Taylorina sp.]